MRIISRDLSHYLLDRQEKSSSPILVEWRVVYGHWFQMIAKQWSWVRLSQKLWLNIESKPTLLTLIPLILTTFEFNQNESPILLLVNLTEFPKALQYNGVKCIIWLSFDYGNWFKHLSLSDTNYIFCKDTELLETKSWWLILILTFSDFWSPRSAVRA